MTSYTKPKVQYITYCIADLSQRISDSLLIMKHYDDTAFLLNWINAD